MQSRWFYFRFNKDIARNNCWHYSYLQDVPEIREAFRQAGINSSVAKYEKNWRGQEPKQLRHAQKAEESSGTDEESNEEDKILDQGSVGNKEQKILEKRQNKIELVKKKSQQATDADVELRTNIDNAEMKQYSIDKADFLPYNLKDTEFLNQK